MNQKFPDRSLLYLVIVFMGFVILFGIYFVDKPNHTKETLIAFNEPTYLPTKSSLPDTLLIKEKKEGEKKEEVKEEVKEVIDTFKTTLDETTKIINPKGKRKTEKVKQNKISMTPADSIFFDYLLDNYKNGKINKLGPNELRSDVLIQYYNRKENTKQSTTLTQLGFKIHNKYTNNSKEVANILRFGEDVVLEDIQLVAYILLKQGVPLKQIVPSSYQSDWKPYAIEIGVDPLIDERPVLTYRKIRNFERPRTRL